MQIVRFSILDEQREALHVVLFRSTMGPSQHAKAVRARSVARHCGDDERFSGAVPQTYLPLLCGL